MQGFFSCKVTLLYLKVVLFELIPTSADFVLELHDELTTDDQLDRFTQVIDIVVYNFFLSHTPVGW